MRPSPMRAPLVMATLMLQAAAAAALADELPAVVPLIPLSPSAQARQMPDGHFTAAPVPNPDLLPPRGGGAPPGPSLAPSLGTTPRSQAIGEGFMPGSKLVLPEDRKPTLAPGLNLSLPLN